METRIKELRREKGETQIKVSTALGIDQSNYSKIELGKHELRMKELIKIADYFKVSLDYLVGRTDKKEINTYTN